jgi:hypothetical protein
VHTPPPQPATLTVTSRRTRMWWECVLWQAVMPCTSTSTALASRPRQPIRSLLPSLAAPCTQARPEPMGGSFDGHRAGPMRGAASALVSGVSTEVAESEVGQVVPWVSPMLVAHMGPARGPAAKPVLLSPSQGRYYDTDSLEVCW